MGRPIALLLLVSPSLRAQVHFDFDDGTDPGWEHFLPDNYLFDPFTVSLACPGAKLEIFLYGHGAEDQSTFRDHSDTVLYNFVSGPAADRLTFERDFTGFGLLQSSNSS